MTKPGENKNQIMNLYAYQTNLYKDCDLELLDVINNSELLSKSSFIDQGEDGQIQHLKINIGDIPVIIPVTNELIENNKELYNKNMMVRKITIKIVDYTTIEMFCPTVYYDENNIAYISPQDLAIFKNYKKEVLSSIRPIARLKKYLIAQ